MALDMNAAVKISATVNGQSAVDQLRNSMDKMSSSAMNVGKALGAAFVVTEVVQAMIGFGKAIIDNADQLDEMAQRTGLTVEQLSELDYAAKISGTSIDAVQTAMGKLAAKATDAAAGNKTAAVAFDALGISVTNANGGMKSQLQLFEEVGAQIAEIRDPTIRAAMAIEVFGKSGAQLLPLLQDMGALRQEARELGGVVGSDFASSAAQFNDNLDRMALMAKGLAKTLLNELLPAVNDVMTQLIAGKKIFGSFSSAALSIGTTNPFLSLEENAKKYNDRVVELEASIKKYENSTSFLGINNVKILKDQLETTKKLAEYFNTMVDVGKPKVPTPAVEEKDTAAERALARIREANKETVKLTDAQREAKRAEEERAQILQQLSDSVLKLKDGEEGLTIDKLKRLGASQKEIEQAKELMFQRALLNGQLEEEKRLKKEIEDAFSQQADEEDARLDKRNRAAQKFADESKRLWEETRTPLEKYNEELQRIEQLYEKGGITLETYIRGQAKALEELKSAGISTFNETRTPLERYNQEFERLDQLLKDGVINYETFQRGVEKAYNEMNNFGKKTTTVFKEMETAMLGFARDSADAIVEFVSGAEDSFSKLATSILKDLARLAIYKTITEPLFNWAGSFLPNANGNAFMNGSVQAFAAGGVVNSPTLFPMANGTGLMGEAGPEAIMPLQRTSSGKLGVIAQGGGGTNNVTVNVNVESGQSTTDADSTQAEKLGGYISKAVQAELMKQKRPGGVLFTGA